MNEQVIGFNNEFKPEDSREGQGSWGEGLRHLIDRG
jgi:hypothetical protein